MIKCDSSNTQIFFSKIFHKRLRPKIHEFRYNNLYVSVPIRSYSRTENKGNVFFGLNRCSFLTINDIDHGDGKPLIEWIENILLKFKLKVDGEIWLSTFPKVLRLGFKPVSFWFCENKKNQIVAVVVEVNNTFKQREIYVLSPKKDEHYIANGQTLASNKKFYVSPFIEISGTYNFRFFRGKPQKKETSRIELIDEDGPLFISSVSGEKLNTDSLVGKVSLVYFLFLPLLTLVRINWQALKLWLKGIKIITRKVQ